LAPLVAVLWVSVLTLMRVYQFGRVVDRAREVSLIIKAHGVALLLFIAITYMYEEYRYSRLAVVYFAGMGVIGIVSFHLLARNVLAALRARGVNRRRVLAVGDGQALAGLIERVSRFPELGLHLEGVVVPDGTSYDTIYGQRVLGRFSEVAEIVRREKMDEVQIALAPSQSQEIDRILEALRDETVDVRVALDVRRYVQLGCEIEDFDGLPVVHINDSPLIGLSGVLKRATDAVLSAIGLGGLSPLLLLIAALVKITSRGPVLYVQERMGLDGRSFNMLKFRSMKVDAEAQTGAVWAQAVDDRRTAFGTFLRKTSLDELPQLWNVLVGDMSLVGPRPERPVFVDRFRKEIPNYMLRHKVQAGITGWAQVNGWRGNTSLDRRIECDLFYIRNWSYILDLKILTLTLWKGFIHKNAY